MQQFQQQRQTTAQVSFCSAYAGHNMLALSINSAARFILVMQYKAKIAADLHVGVCHLTFQHLRFCFSDGSIECVLLLLTWPLRQTCMLQSVYQNLHAMLLTRVLLRCSDCHWGPQPQAARLSAASLPGGPLPGVLAEDLQPSASCLCRRGANLLSSRHGQVHPWDAAFWLTASDCPCLSMSWVESTVAAQTVAHLDKTLHR